MTFCGRILAMDFMPHGHCYFWQPEILWPHVLGDGLTAISYFIIPVLLIWFMRKRKDLSFNVLFWAFALFILSCGTTHALAIVSVWDPIYEIEAIVKILTALISFATVIILIWKMPMLLSIPSVDQLKAKNEELLHEIAERKRAEEEVRKLNADLEERVKKRTRELEKSNQELELFTSMVSHDLRSPLRTLGEIAEIVSLENKEKLSPDGIEGLSLITSKSKNLSQLVDDLLQLSRMRNYEPHFETIHIRSLLEPMIDEILGDYDGMKERCKVFLNVDQKLTIAADKSLITQVFRNLIDNAVKYSTKVDEPRITINATGKDDSVQFTISDNGAGFDSAKADQLFEPFKRLHTSKEFFGTGMGLAIVKRIVNLHNGKINAQSSPGKGAEFHFTLRNESMA